MLLSWMCLPQRQVQGVSGGETVLRLASASPAVTFFSLWSQTLQSKAANCNAPLTNEIVHTRSVYSLLGVRKPTVSSRSSVYRQVAIAQEVICPHFDALGTAWSWAGAWLGQGTVLSCARSLSTQLPLLHSLLIF